MTIEQTVEIPASHRLILDLPRDIPVGRAKAALTLTFEAGEGTPGKALSKRFAGALRLSDADYEAFQNTLRTGRNEWDRDIS
ncbi:hypothetical protein FACS1894137_15090 [Spirochaetia bacterium]|nr:hypothetical protein FACS1894137_15090 [Spirochaetia bacterium]